MIAGRLESTTGLEGIRHTYEKVEVGSTKALSEEYNRTMAWAYASKRKLETEFREGAAAALVYIISFLFL